MIPGIEELIQSTPDVREDKIRRVRQKLKKGSYKVDADRIAQKIIEDNLLEEIYLKQHG